MAKTKEPAGQMQITPTAGRPGLDYMASKDPTGRMKTKADQAAESKERMRQEALRREQRAREAEYRAREQEARAKAEARRVLEEAAAKKEQSEQEAAQPSVSNSLIAAVEREERFQSLKTIVGADVALFVLCAYCDYPYKPSVPASSWDQYIHKVPMKSMEHFRDGETDIFKAIDLGIADEQRWEKVWGLGNKDSRYTVEDYKRLDEIFFTYTERLNKSGGYDIQQEDTLRHCSRMALLRDKCVSKGDKESIDKAQKLDKMIQENLSSENLRRKDEKPTQTARLDGIVEAIKKKCGVGVELTQEQAAEICAKWLTERRYSITMDAAEHAILAIVNNIRTNSDLPLVAGVTDEMKLDRYSAEFQSAPSQNEKEVYEYLGIERKEPKRRW